MGPIYRTERYSALVEIKSDVTMEPVEKRVRLDVETGKAVFELLNPSPMGGKILLKLIWAEQASTLRTNLKN